MTSKFQQQALLKAAQAVKKVFSPKPVAPAAPADKQLPVNEDWMEYAA